MATGTISIRHGWGAFETLKTDTYGTLYGRVNPFTGLAQLSWRGNSSAPSAATNVTVTVAKYASLNDEVQAPLRNGDQIAVNSSGVITVYLTAHNWSGGSIVYPAYISA